MLNIKVTRYSPPKNGWAGADSDPPLEQLRRHGMPRDASVRQER